MNCSKVVRRWPVITSGLSNIGAINRSFQSVSVRKLSVSSRSFGSSVDSYGSNSSAIPTKSAFKNLATLNVTEVSQLFSNLKIPLNSVEVHKANLDGEMLTVLERNEELREIGLAIPTLKFKILRKHIQDFSVNGVHQSLITSVPSKPLQNEQQKQQPLEVEITRVPKPNTATQQQPLDPRRPTDTTARTASSKAPAVPAATPVFAKSPATQPPQRQQQQHNAVFPIRVIDVESAIMAMEIIHTDSLLQHSLNSTASTNSTMESILKLIRNSPENQILAGESGLCEQAVDNLIALTECEASKVAGNVPIVEQTLQLISLLCRHSPSREATCEANVIAFDESGCIEG